MNDRTTYVETRHGVLRVTEHHGVLTAHGPRGPVRVDPYLAVHIAARAQRAAGRAHSGKPGPGEAA